MSETALNNNLHHSHHDGSSLNLSGQPQGMYGTSQGNISYSGNHSGPYEEYFDIILIFLPKYEKEFIQSIRVVRNANGDVDLCDIMKTLKGMAFPIERNVVSYYSYTNDMYVYCGNDPIQPNSFIPANEVYTAEGTPQVTIRIRQVLTNMPINLEPITEGDNVKFEGSVNFAGEGPNSTKQKRTKERKIGEILDKVLQWRRLYTGVIDPATGQTIKMSLEEAAQRVGISKKSLDDYLLQIRFGKKYGFNFNDHFNERVGVLRTFVKKHKGKKDEKIEDTSDGVPEFDDDEIAPKNEGINKRSKKI